MLYGFVHEAEKVPSSTGLIWSFQHRRRPIFVLLHALRTQSIMEKYTLRKALVALPASGIDK